MKKFVFLSLILVSLFSSVKGQDLFAQLYQQGLNQERQQRYYDAIKSYNAAIVITDNKDQIKRAKDRIEYCASRLEQLRQLAEAGMANTNQELKEAKEKQQNITDSLKQIIEAQRKKTDSVIKTTKQLIDKIYFYNNKLALAYYNGKFGFIDKNGQIKIAFKYDHALPFDNKLGIAQVTIETIQQNNKKIFKTYYIDTAGNEYTKAYNISGLTDSTEAIDLSNRNIKNIPKELFKYTKLKIVILQNNNLSNLPKTIENFSELVILDLGRNKLTKLTENIRNLKKLQKLFVNDNILTEFPEEILQLKKLTTLDLRYNQLNRLPDSISNLENLENLFLANNNLDSLPESIGVLNSLQTLDLSHNRLSTLPDTLGTIKTLALIKLQGNPINNQNFIQFLRSCTKPVKLTTVPEYNDDPTFLLIVVDEIEPEWVELPNVERY